MTAMSDPTKEKIDFKKECINLFWDPKRTKHSPAGWVMSDVLEFGEYIAERVEDQTIKRCGRNVDDYSRRNLYEMERFYAQRASGEKG